MMPNADFLGKWRGTLDRDLAGIGLEFAFKVNEQTEQGAIEGWFRNSADEEIDIAGTVNEEEISFTVTYGVNVYCFRGNQVDIQNRRILGIAPPGPCGSLRGADDDASWDAEARNPPMNRHNDS